MHHPVCRHHNRGRRKGTSTTDASVFDLVSLGAVVVPSLVPYAAGARTAKVRVGFLVKNICSGCRERSKANVERRREYGERFVAIVVVNSFIFDKI